MKKRILSATLCALLVCQCQSTDEPPTIPTQEPPETPLAAEEAKRVYMTREDHEYMVELLEPFMEAETDIIFHEKGENADKEPLGSVAPSHFRVLAACPNKVYTGELSATFSDYVFSTADGYSLTISMSPKHEHGIRVGGIAISSPTFHHFLQTIIRKKKAEREEAAKAAEEAVATSEKEKD